MPNEETNRSRLHSNSLNRCAPKQITSEKRGIKFTSFQIDEQGGYSIDNIQILTNSKNVKKFLDYRYNGGKMEFKTVTLKPAVIDNCPF